MPVSWSKPKADAEPVKLLAECLKRYRPDLFDAKVRVLVMLAHNPDGPALKRGGDPCAALVKVCGLHDRVAHGYDAEVKLDDREWEDFTDRRRRAVLFHELKHLELVTKGLDDGREVVALDDCGRPKLKLTPGDWVAGDGFHDVVEEFGEDALEYENAERAWGAAERAAGPLPAGR